ncbi:hypothetical protein P0D91_05545 [Pseudomonas sp. CBSPBW29]|uniref:hypothetical protein n=1 Tax=Pseudomonas sp. CBS TaxID=2971912 RepID=UPI0021ACA3AB|nr:hypothetical protein [Pseudomonas sp. CBS]WEL43760.1 hypothetical protein P0D91_05545 [Pseudomonas sp. CBSPBW29]WEL64832.1 hypothetical protein P0D93_33095 [Pseudomonas sp. CBSPGW29]WEL68299.1 hypothetical protein P0D94_19005 [Pseudomonas sp. CBSPCGW29]WEL75321.1 hypothetical protein P0D92_25060 [Pseudomonas sp. CBSPAW29]WEL80439.1 hypothetical protein P0D95_20745 [Pseudomonas sp. CBSPCAW29]WEL88951.1 hypothetical protein P0D90_03005 [Pseudomonas sp. CBSPCBW29]
MLRKLNDADKKSLLDFSYDFLSDLDSIFPRNSVVFKKYNKKLKGFRDLLTDFFNRGLLDKDDATSLFVALIQIRRNDILRSNISKGNMEYALKVVASMASRSRMDLHKLCTIMAAHYRIRSVASSESAFQILQSLYDSGAVSVYTGFLREISDHLDVVNMGYDIDLS